jgi:hypothetical protein
MSPLRSLWYRVNYTDALLDRPRHLLLDWSAKAGCTVAVKMLLRYQGLLEEAEKGTGWVHNYRIRVYYAAHGVATRRDLVDPDLVKIKVVRNPYDRAVSSYITVARDLAKEFADAVGTEESDLSFRQFLALLERIDLSACNPHYRKQVRPYEEEDVRFDAIVHLERLGEDLSELTRRHGIPLDPTGLTSDHHFRRSDRVMPGAADAPWSVLTETTIPAYASFYDADTRQRVEALYGADFAHYGYATKPGCGVISDEPRNGLPRSARRRDAGGLSYGARDVVRYLCRPLRRTR